MVEKVVDKNLCMSRFLSFRFVREENIEYFPGLSHSVWRHAPDWTPHVVDGPDAVERWILAELEAFFKPGRTAIFLSGGIDSAIIASYLPAGTKAYTFHCVADGAIDEREQAAKYARAYGLDHEIIDMTWQDHETLTPELLKMDHAPFHSIEIQLLKAARHARAAGYERVILGDGADTLFGGLDGFLSKDRTLEEFRNRFAFVPPEMALKNPVDVRDVYRQFLRPDGIVDPQGYINNVLAIESGSSYMHALAPTGLQVLAPYCNMKLDRPLDIARIRAGEPKYILRELFTRRYPDIPVPRKIPLPRAMTQWFADWKGPTRPEFIPDCQKNMTGDQKWLVWCLEKFLDAYDNGDFA